MNAYTYNTYKRRIEHQTGLKLKEATKNEIGKIYYCGYWATTYTVLNITTHEIWGEVYTVQWQDGRIGTHSTRFDPDSDFEVIGGTNENLLYRV